MKKTTDYRLLTTALVIGFTFFALATPIFAAEDSVTAPSLNSSYGVVDTTTRALLPPELYITSTPIPGAPVITPPPIQIGVERSFIDNIKGLFCWLNSTFCSKDVNLYSDKTQDFVDKSAVLIQSERPKEVQPDHLQQDPRLQDNTEAKATGNEKINNIQTSLGTGPGYYSNNLPGFDNETKIIDPNNPPPLYIQAKTSNNLTLGTKTFDQDLRVPDISIRQDLYNKSNYPDGIAPFKDTVAAGQ